MKHGYVAFQIHHSLNLHFNDTVLYDALKYNFKTNSNSFKYFDQNKNKWQYAWIEGNVKDLLYATMECFRENDYKYLPFKQYLNMVKLFKDVSHHEVFDSFKNDLTWLEQLYYDDKNKLFEVGDLYPRIYEHYKKGDIKLYTVLLIDAKIKKFINKDNSRDIIVWPEFIKTADKVEKLLCHIFEDSDIRRIFKSYYLMV